MTQIERPRIELKSITHNASLSEETHCYSATLYVDGEKWGTVANRGHGGADEFHGVGGKTWHDLKALDERIGATFPEMDLTSVGCPGETMKESLETVCGGLVNDWLTEREIKRALKRAAVFYPDGLPAEGETGTLREIVLKGRSLESAIVHIKAKYPNVVIINELPEAERHAAWRRAA